MGKLTDVAIRAWIRSGERFEGRSDGDGLVLTWRPERSSPSWKLRYRFADKSRVMNLGSHTDLPLAAARSDEFELEVDPPVWHLPGIRTKTGQPLDSPLPSMAVEWLQKLKELACNAEHVLPARELPSRMVPHVCESTLGVAMGKVKHGLPHFTVHDFRRTARTHLAALGVEPHVAERCLNYKLKGVEGVYNRHDYFEERRRALEAWGQLLLKLERQQPPTKKPAAARQPQTTAENA